MKISPKYRAIDKLFFEVIDTLKAHKVMPREETTRERGIFKTTAALRLLALSALLCLQVGAALGQSSQRYIFNDIITLDGLSDNNVNYTHETQSGTLVMCTDMGLNIYSNGHIEVYTHNPQKPNSIPSNKVRFATDYVSDVSAIRRQLWISTDNGLCRYDASNEAFHMIYDEDGNSIDALDYEVVEGAIVFVASDGRMLKLDVETNEVESVAKLRISSEHLTDVEMCRFISDNQFLVAAGNDGLIVINTVDGSSRYFCERDKELFARDVAFDANGNVWLCTDEMVVKYNSRGRELNRFAISPHGAISRELACLQCVGDKVWVGTRGDGIALIDINTSKRTYINHVSGGNRMTLPDNNITHIAGGRGYYVWVSTPRSGTVGIKQTSIVSYGEVQRNVDAGLSFQTISCFYDDFENRQILIGTDGGGVNIYDTVTEKFRHIPIVDKKDRIGSLVRLNRNSIVVSIDGDGIYVLDEHTGAVIRSESQIINQYKEILFPTSETHVSLHRDRDGEIFALGPEIMRYNPVTHRCDFVENNPAFGLRPIIYSAEEDKLKFFAGNTLYSFDKRNMTIETVFVNDLPVISAAEGIMGHLGIVDNSGLKIRSVEQTEFTRLELPFNTSITAMQVDNRRRLWLGTTNGQILCNTDHSSNFKTFSTSDGVLRSVFFDYATLLSDSGDVYFGAQRGFVRIFNDIDVSRNYDPEVELLSWNSDSDFIFDKRNDNITEITLPNDYHDISMRVSAIGFDMLGLNSFRFNIKGPVNRETVTSKDTYKFIMPNSGRYEMRVSCSTSTGLWTEPKLLAIINVTAPWYMQWWFLAIFVSIIAAAGYTAISRVMAVRKRRYNDIMQQNELSEQQSKLNMFTDISHEIRTPLTLIYAPLKRLIEELPENNSIRARLEKMMVQVDRLTRLTNLVLDVQKIEQGFESVTYTENDYANDWLEEETEPFRTEFEERHITLQYDLSPDITSAVFDKLKLKIVVSNLLSNAVKYSFEHTTVTVRSQLIEVNQVKLWRVSVVNRGIGLGDKNITELFGRFKRGDNTEGITGYGVGLSYANNIIKLHLGYMSAFDKDEDTTFYFDIPLDLTVTPIHDQVDLVTKATDTTISKAVEKVDKPQVVEQIERVDKPLSVYDMAEAEQQENNTTIDFARLQMCTLMIVEDDRSLRDYMKDEFSSYFRKVYVAVDGRDALEKVLTQRPDIVISDVVMPNMNGFELCRAIKTNVEISHIPVLLLTARTDADSVSTGYKMGADMYMSKPFDVDNLLVILYNHLTRRDIIRRKYSQPQTGIDTKELSFSNADEMFLEKLNKIINDNIGNSELDMSFIINQMGLSRTSFYAKLKAIIDITPVAYINKLRIQRAAEMLATTDKSIADICFTVGFTDHAYFSSMFKEMMGITPKEYRFGSKKLA